MHIVFTDKIDRSFVKILEKSGHSCEVFTAPPEDNSYRFLEAAEVLVVRSRRVTGPMLDSASNLGLIVRAGAGTDNIDVQAASEKGIYVCNVPGKNAAAVAELTMGLLLAVDRSIPAATADLREGRWDKAEYSRANGLKGRSMAIIGLGEIGFEVAQRATAFGIQVRALDRTERSADAVKRIAALDIHMCASLKELLEDAEIVSLHLPLTDRTRNTVDGRFLQYLPEGAILLNTARGGLIDQKALLEAMDRKGIRVGLDVYVDEPSASSADWRTSFTSHPNFVGTHHIGASTAQAQDAIAGGVVDAIEAYASGRLINCVNLVDRPLGACAITVRHRDEVGVLAAVLACLRGAGINVQQMQNEIFSGASPTAAVATIRASMTPSTQTLEDLRQLESVLRVDIVERV